MKGSFRETDLDFAAEVREFIDRYWPESARGGSRPNQASTAEIGAWLDALDEALEEIPDGRGGVLARDPVLRRRVQSLKVEFAALRALELRAIAGADGGLEEDTAAIVLGIRCVELRLAATGLMTDALAWYALPMPDERPGDNEASLGGGYVPRARQGMLAGLFGHPGTLDAQRDWLARRLLKALEAGESCAGH